MTQDPAITQGRLEVVCGPMFAGKSTRLLARGAELVAAGVMVQAFKPSSDDRYDGARHIVTHDRRRLEAVPIARAEQVLDTNALAVIIDEIHFFGDELVAPCMRLVHAGRLVIVAGVDRDHRGRPFSPFPALLCEADRVDKLHAVCARCGGLACHTQRLVESGETIVVGGAEAYEPRCRGCFRPAP